MDMRNNNNSISNVSKFPGNLTQRNNSRTFLGAGNNTALGFVTSRHKGIELRNGGLRGHSTNLSKKPTHSFSVRHSRNQNINSARNFTQNIPNLILTQSIRASVKPCQKLLNSPELKE